MALLLPFRGQRPRVAPDAFLAPTAVLIGDVVIESEASVWFGAVLRGDNPEHGIVVGPRRVLQKWG
ncbi:MAG: gamma carbonic anhydrase family protein, partial [Gemmatimonadetes bacterium]|nr:gamma carbonic anhydrase family protein [Gemmatimonadota bacterium]